MAMVGSRFLKDSVKKSTLRCDINKNLSNHKQVQTSWHISKGSKILIPQHLLNTAELVMRTPSHFIKVDTHLYHLTYHITQSNRQLEHLKKALVCIVILTSIEPSIQLILGIVGFTEKKSITCNTLPSQFLQRDGLFNSKSKEPGSPKVWVGCSMMIFSQTWITLLTLWKRQ